VRSQTKAARLSTAGTKSQIDPSLRSQRYGRKQPTISARAVRTKSAAVWIKIIDTASFLWAITSHHVREESSSKVMADD
jgi:hypothetical protein